MDTEILSIEQVNKWRLPPFQRPLQLNSKVMAIAAEMRSGEVSIKGVLTLGKLRGDPGPPYLVDGQHRVEAFRQSGVQEIIADVRVVTFDGMAEMADEFVNLNTAMVRMRPDDLLRGLTPSLPNLGLIIRQCPFIGYDQVRRGKADSGAVVSLSVALKCWLTSSFETPAGGKASISSVAHTVNEHSASQLIRFMHLALDAWGRDPEYYRLWGVLNMTLCMWLYRKLVINVNRRAVERVITLNDAQFRKCIASLSSSQSYMDWLLGKTLSDRDRNPGFLRVKQIFVRRLTEEGVAKPILPSPAWSSK